MIDFAGRGLRPSLPVACLLAATLCLGLAGCASKPKPQPTDEVEDYTPPKKEWSILDPFAPKEFREVEVALPAPPQEADLIPFEVSPAGNFTFAVDGKSVIVGADGAVRYTVVITGASGMRNVSFEAVRCDTFERKMYATLPRGATEWVRNRSDDRDGWVQLAGIARNNYGAALAKDFLCEGRSAAGTAQEIVKDLRGEAPRKSAITR
ncbi:CNP1-like family protein [Cupriavidus basilensis]|uniref:CNP1-like family protein n=1 Tax=Cupriavidus basilensis TaxID=68895 RepID=A0A643FTA0_9BURK|nr:CNP1-like family protein [Cupriavidus basilensis]MDR3379164.1 CNP1-like family protein [Cupriavidus basilensis]QOT76004.1 CNP1-like family protein [Cupriavidus basilensis]